jgi:spermidine synthase
MGKVLERLLRSTRERFSPEELDCGLSLSNLEARSNFDQLRQSIRKAGTDCRSYFGNDYELEGGYALQQNSSEFAGLVSLLIEKEPFSSYLEIGLGSGGTCRFIVEHTSVREVIAIDDGNHIRAREQQQNLQSIGRINRFVGNSHTRAASEFLRSVGIQYDVALVDGDHSEEGVRQDVDLVMPFLQNGGWIILHDTVACEGVRRCWRDLCRHRNFSRSSPPRAVNL